MARFQGRLIEWHDDKGYGFVQALDDARQQRVFLHIKNFKRPGPRPIVGCVVEYELSIDSQSRPQATQVSYVKVAHVQKNRTSSSYKGNSHNTGKSKWQPMYILMTIYWVVMLVLSSFGLLPVFSLLIILLINAYTYWLYHQDKQAAMQNAQRISEQHLLLMSALGGWTAAWFAAQNFRHKTQKQPFNTYFKLCIVIHFVLIGFAVFAQQRLI